jgi:hypothetical protein
LVVIVQGPNNNTSFVSNGNVFAIDIAYFKLCSIAQSMLLIIMDISSIMMTFAIFWFFYDIVSFREEYPHTRMQNVVCIVAVVEHKQNVDVHIVADNNTFLKSIWKCCVIYFTKKNFPLLGVHVKTCKPCGFSIMEWNTFCCSWFNCIIEKFVSNVCFKGFDPIYISCDCSLIVGGVVASVLWCKSKYGWSSNISWRN